MYFELLAFYKRDTVFSFNEDLNQMSILELNAGGKVDVNETLEFSVDKIDNYIESYDLLPSYDTPLVSSRFKTIFSDLTDDLQFIKARITDEKNNKNESFYFMNILNALPIMDNDRSVTEMVKYGKATFMKIKKLFIIDSSLKGHSIVRMAENDSHIIITSEFKKRCEKASLKGIDFTEEGYSIYS